MNALREIFINPSCNQFLPLFQTFPVFLEAVVRRCSMKNVLKYWKIHRKTPVPAPVTPVLFSCEFLQSS